ncbi:hypothetical protein GCM10029992_29740 [Glycomyces albus]
MSVKIADTAEKSEDPVRVVFIGGLGRSGTTLLERLLGQLPGVVPLGEITHLWERDLVGDEMCACGATFSYCEFWQRIGKAAFGSWEEVDVERLAALKATVDRTRHIPALASKKLASDQYKLVAEYASHFEKIYRAAAADTGARVVVDSSKHASLAYCLRWAPGIDLRIMHVVRDSRGVAYSWTKQVRRPESPTGDQMTRYSPPRPRCCGTRRTRRSACWRAGACRCGGSGTSGSSSVPATSSRPWPGSATSTWSSPT